MSIETEDVETLRVRVRAWEDIVGQIDEALGGARTTSVGNAVDLIDKIKKLVHDGRDPRVFWPGDSLPTGEWVVARDGIPAQVSVPAEVDPKQPVPLVEVPIPNYFAVVERAAQRDGKTLGEHPVSKRWGVIE